MDNYRTHSANDIKSQKNSGANVNFFRDELIFQLFAKKKMLYSIIVF